MTGQVSSFVPVPRNFGNRGCGDGRAVSGDVQAAFDWRCSGDDARGRAPGNQVAYTLPLCFLWRDLHAGRAFLLCSLPRRSAVAWAALHILCPKLAVGSVEVCKLRRVPVTPAAVHRGRSAVYLCFPGGCGDPGTQVSASARLCSRLCRPAGSAAQVTLSRDRCRHAGAPELAAAASPRLQPGNGTRCADGAASRSAACQYGRTGPVHALSDGSVGAATAAKSRWRFSHARADPRAPCSTDRRCHDDRGNLPATGAHGPRRRR